MGTEFLQGDNGRAARIRGRAGLPSGRAARLSLPGILLLAVLGAGGAPAHAAPPLDACNGGFQTMLREAAHGGEARGVWLNRQLIQWPGIAASAGRFKLYHSADGRLTAAEGAKVGGADGSLALDLHTGQVPPAAAARFKYLAAGIVLALKDADLERLPELHRRQLLLVHENDAGEVGAATYLQAAGALDDLYAAAGAADGLGATPAAGETRFRLWAPTARRVALCLYDSADGAATAIEEMRREDATGIWSAARPADLSGKYYRYAVDVFARNAGLVRNLVTDPYSVSLAADSKRSYIADLDAAALKPAGWDKSAAPRKVRAQTDMVIYELHVRDFSINDPTVSRRHRGKYLAFTESGSNGMKHLRALSAAGLTDVHLLPVFDLATVPETQCATPAVAGAPDSEAQQAAVAQAADRDCFNWGYDPYHYSAPEGSYASDAADGARRIIEFRRMVMALHRAGLRVGMDVVYNHTAASGQQEKSVLDRIVPGYYHRLDAAGAVERSTCCDNTATENMMMGKLMIDSAVLWARHYKIDSFRFDLMAHQPRATMEALQAKVDAARGSHVNLIGEGWNFGEVADGARFVQASQLSLNGSGIGTFSDRARDAARGGGAAESGLDLVRNQGYINGLVTDPNAASGKRPVTDLMQSADLIRVGLAGSIRDYRLVTHRDVQLPLQDIVYGGDQPAGYVSQPGEVVNYVENHDNQTLFDINVFKLPLAVSREDRVRVQMLGVAIVAFSQGVAYYHAGIDTLRSKSLDRNSYDSGDWFNRIDWSYRDNYFGTGAPPKRDNGADYAIIKPLLANPSIKPGAREIALARDMFRDLLKIRASSTLFRLRSADDIRRRLRFYNTGARQNPAVIAAHLDGAGYAGAGFGELVYFINVDKTPHAIAIEEEKGKRYELHPVHVAANAADKRPAQAARYDAGSGRFDIPARSAVVFVRR
ncbi:MAG TPA: alpha-1,6-glucosidase domain-containing protein [Paucimonas sp.]|nr:alpha-1,6-glucosidase domain-containing protein [Paucimonas sp.]